MEEIKRKHGRIWKKKTLETDAKKNGDDKEATIIDRKIKKNMK